MEKNTSNNTVMPAELVCDRQDEEKMLNWLLGNTEIALDRVNELYEAGFEPSYAEDTIRITINGYHHDFVLGGPQYAAIGKFCEQIAYENGHAVDTGDSNGRLTNQDIIETLQIITVHMKVAQETTHVRLADMCGWLISGILSGARFVNEDCDALTIKLTGVQTFAVWLALDMYCRFAEKEQPETLEYYSSLRDKFAASDAHSSREAYRRDIYGD